MLDLYPEQCLRALTPDESRSYFSFSSSSISALQTLQVAGDGTNALSGRGYNRMNTLTTLTMNRRSCRNYTDETLARERLTDLINAAVWVPNGSNNQPLKFVVITDKALLKKYSDAAKGDWLARLAETPHMQQYEKPIRALTTISFTMRRRWSLSMEIRIPTGMCMTAAWSPTTCICLRRNQAWVPAG